MSVRFLPTLTSLYWRLWSMGTVMTPCSSKCGAAALTRSSMPRKLNFCWSFQPSLPTGPTAFFTAASAWKIVGSAATVAGCSGTAGAAFMRVPSRSGRDSGERLDVRAGEQADEHVVRLGGLALDGGLLAGIRDVAGVEELVVLGEQQAGLVKKPVPGDDCLTELVPHAGDLIGVPQVVGSVGPLAGNLVAAAVGGVFEQVAEHLIAGRHPIHLPAALAWAVKMTAPMASESS